MADNIPLFPTETNVETFRDFVNLQKELNDHLMAERHLYEQIGRVSLDVESRVVKRRNNEFNMMKQIRDKMLEVNILTERRANTIGTERDELERVIKATLEDIKHTKNLIAMSREANDIEMAMAKKIHEENNRWFNFASKKLNDLFGMKVKEFDITEGIGEELLKQGIRGEALAYTFGAILMMLKGAYTTFLAFDKAAWKFRKAMGMTRDEAQVIRQQAERMTIDFMHLGVTIDGAYKSFQALGKVFGGIHNVSEDMIKTFTALSVSFGINADISARALQTMAGVSGTTLQANKYAILFGKSLAKAAGVPLNDVMKQISSLSGDALNMISRNPVELMKAAVAAQRYGITLSSLSSAMRQSLNFTESVNKEMEASVLLGKSLNLQTFRQLSYQRDARGTMNEINKILAQTHFEKLDPIQAKAVAEALGMSEDALYGMAVSQRHIEDALRSSDPRVKSLAQEYNRLNKLTDARVRLEAKSVEHELMTKNNLSHSQAISASWNKIMMQLGQIFLPAIDTILGFVADNLGVILGLGASVYGGWKILKSLGVDIASVLKGWGERIFFFGMKKNWKWLESVGSWIDKIGMKIAGISKFTWVTKLVGLSRAFGFIFNFANKIASKVLKFLVPLFFAINIFKEIKKILNDPALMGTKGFFAFNGKLLLRSVGAIVRALWTTLNDFAFGLPGLIAKGIASVSNSIFGSLLSPFKAAWAWLGKWFLGSSPSTLGLMILDGISSIGGMLLDSITAPFKSAWSFVSGFGAEAMKTFDPVLSIGENILKSIVSVGPALFSALTMPFRMLMSWIDKVPLIGGILNKMGLGTEVPGPKSIEKKAQAAYIPAVTVSPTGTKIESRESKPAEKAGKVEEKDTSQPMSEDTGQEIVALLKKLVDKDVGVNIDGSKLSTFLARNVEFRGSFGTNR